MVPLVDVAGRSALEVELLRRSLATQDGAVAEAAAYVVVLVQPTPDHWRNARMRRQRVVLVGGGTDADQMLAAFLDGADAVLSGDVHPDDLRRAVDRVAAGETLIDAHVARSIVDELRGRREEAVAAAVSLTSREQEILSAIDAGLSVKQTARHLGIASKTVENLQSRLFRKLGARNRAQAVMVGHELGLFNGPGLDAAADTF